MPDRWRPDQPAPVAAAHLANWAGNQSCAPAAIRRPGDRGRARRRSSSGPPPAGRHVKVVGAGHSFTPLVCTDGDLVDLRDYDRVLDGRPGGRTVTVAGRHPAVAAERRAGRATAWPSRTSATSPTSRSPAPPRPPPTAPACASATCRAASSGCASSPATARWSRPPPDQNPDVLDVARVGVGALGILSTVTVQCVPALQPARRRAGRAGRRGARAVGGRDRRQRPLRVLLGPRHPLGADQAQPAHRRAGRAPPAVAGDPRRLRARATSPST